MEFVIHYKKNSGQRIIPSVISHNEPPIPVSEKFSITLIETKGKLYLNRITGEKYEFLIFGDLIFNEKARNNESEKLAFLVKALTNGSIYKLKGFFYIIAIDRVNFKVEVHSGLFNILPLYYFQDAVTVLISTSIRNMLNYSKKKFSFSEKYAVEKILFYYSFENRTLYDDINLVPSCSYIEVGGGSFSIKKTYSPYDLYVSSPEPWRKSLDWLSDVFLNEFENYLPAEPATISLTGGFDGRTVLSAAIKYGYIPETFSYGSPLGSDIMIPQKIAETLNFHHHSFLLTREYAKESFWDDGLEFLEKTDFSGNISRAHYVHVAKALSKNFNYLLTGNFGSELFRSMKSPGVMASPALFALFLLHKKKKFEKYVLTIPSLRYLNKETIEKELPEIINHVWEYKQQLPAELSANQKFYTYIFGEAFRKYFGPEIIFQSHYIINRSPFLDFRFIKELLKTKNSGAYSNFSEQSPFSRFHGQVLYSHIIKKACPKLLSLDLDKGYKPVDFFTIAGEMRIMQGYLKRKYKSSRNSKEPSYSSLYYQENVTKIATSIVDSPFLDVDCLKNELGNSSRMQDQACFINVLSLDLSYDQKF